MKERRDHIMSWKIWLVSIGILVLASQLAKAQEDTVQLSLSGGILEGSLIETDDSTTDRSLIILVAGSGPTDRDGNQPQGGAASLKMLADSLVQRGISTFRFDKRGVGRSVFPSMQEADLRLDTFVADLGRWIDHWLKDGRFDQLILAGHSEGALLATLAAERYPGVDALITLAGAGRTADSLIMLQLERQPPFVMEAADSLFRLIRAGLPAESPPFLMALFRPDVQPYLRSWMQYDPSEVIGRLDKPVLVVQGGNDLQVFTEDARRLADAARQSSRLNITDMNHVLKPVTGLQDNIASYTDADRPLHPDLIPGLVAWLTSYEKTQESE